MQKSPIIERIGIISRRRFLIASSSCLAYLKLPCVGKREVVMAEESGVPDWVRYPGDEWETIRPKDAGIGDTDAWYKWVEKMESRAHGAHFQGEDHSENQWGFVVTRGGYLLAAFGDPDYRYQTASLGKCFTMACLQLAIDEGLIDSADDPIRKYWTGIDQLNKPHKYLDQGNHRFLSFNHLKTHTGGFPITNGWTWQSCMNYSNPAPDWAKCTGDPDYDNYAHAKPGTVGSHYSSGGYWRLAQALTAVWRRDLKAVLDERLFRYLGIPAECWEWTPGKVVHDQESFYPMMPGYGLFVDPPYEINSEVIRGGPGWVSMSAKDLARFGLLVATGGVWGGRRLISIVQGHNGGNGSSVGGIGGEVMGSWGRVTCNYNHSQIPWKLFTKPPAAGL